MSHYYDRKEFLTLQICSSLSNGSGLSKTCAIFHVFYIW